MATGWYVDWVIGGCAGQDEKQILRRLIYESFVKVAV